MKRQTPMTVKHILLDCTIFYVNAQHFYSEICSTDAFKKNKSKFMLRVFVLYKSEMFYVVLFFVDLISP